MLFYELSKRRPELMKRWLTDGVRKALGADYDVGTHFTPRYNPWDQRVCLVPDDDLFDSIKTGRASVVTDHIECFTEHGLRLRSGTELPADLVVTATGLELQVLGGVDVTVDGRSIELGKALTYKGMMFSDVPNLVSFVGYTNASWTLKCDLSAEYACRLLRYMERRGYRQCTPRCNDATCEPEPWIDFSSGYVLRSIDKFPKQGSKRPWRLYQNYARDLLLLRYGRVEDGVLDFES
jgi:cation diffusion facilitator CzcD-associated flavoprotein CzcO